MKLYAFVLLFLHSILSSLSDPDECSSNEVFIDSTFQSIIQQNLSHVDIDGWTYARLNYSPDWSRRPEGVLWRVDCSRNPSNLSCDNFRLLISRGLHIWLRETGRRAHEVGDGSLTAITVSFENEDHEGESFAGAIAHANSRFVHLNRRKAFHWPGRRDTPRCAYNLYNILVHELGHSLTLGHTSTSPDSIMYPTVSGLSWTREIRQLAERDRKFVSFVFKEALYTTTTTTTIAPHISDASLCLDVAKVRIDSRLRHECIVASESMTRKFLDRLARLYLPTRPIQPLYNRN